MAQRFDRKNCLNTKVGRTSRWAFWLLGAAGLLSLVWFLIRVIPKPSRAAYPCQRVAAPLAGGFVVWALGLLGSVSAFAKAKRNFRRSRYIVAGLCVALSVAGLWLALSLAHDRPAKAEQPERNKPVGVGKGLHPGRVVWVHDPNATDWDGPWQDDGHPWELNNTKQDVVDKMLSQSIQALAGEKSDKKAWDAIFKYFNKSRGKASIGYKSGEKIAIKINLTTCNYNAEFRNVNPQTYEKTGKVDNSDTSPQMIVAVLRQLVGKVRVKQSDISVVDTLAYIPKHYWDICHSEFPLVRYIDSTGRLGRSKAEYSKIVQHWSDAAAQEYNTDYLPKCFAEADYLINMPVLKSHELAGITLCAKNHYGSYIRRPIGWGYFDLHDSLAAYQPAKTSYRALVDIMGHSHMGGKTVLYVIDGLYGGEDWEARPVKWKMPPFNNDWPSSIFVSQDPVAIDCVGLDFLWEEMPHIVRIEAVDDYLLEAAQADKAFYDPDGSGKTLKSLGVYERWNNPRDKKYSRNLGMGNGIELVSLH